MKKGVLIIFVIVITSLALIFSRNLKTHVEVENLHDFLNVSSNRIQVYNEAIKLNQGSSKNTCVYFISEALRKNNFSVPKETSNTSQLITLLKKKGWKKQSDFEKLSPGDICFTTNENSSKDSNPSHTYVFMKWVKAGSYDYAYVCDNQAKDYSGKIYHIRNIRVTTKVNGFVKDAFAFFMKV